MQHTLPPIKILSLSISIFILVGLFTMVTHAQSPSSAVELDGYAWSENIGWISMNCKTGGAGLTDICATSSYRVQINPDNTVTGWAWNPNDPTGVGWIQFGGLSGCPVGTCAAEINTTTNQFTGWARALNGTDPLSPDWSGWDGWISLSGSNYGISFQNTGIIDSTSYAYGADVIGFISFSGVTMGPTCPETTACTANHLGTESTNMWCTVEPAVACTVGEVCADATGTCGPAPHTAGTVCTADHLGTQYTNMWGSSDPVVDCAVGEVCLDTTNACSAVNVTGTLSVTPAVVRKNNTVDISWTVTGSVDSCHVTSSDGDNYTSSPAVSSPVTFNKNVYTLYCISAGGGLDMKIDSVEIQIIPSIYES